MSQPHDPFMPYDEWFMSLTAGQQKRADELMSTFKALGADHAGNLTRAEISEDSPELARFLFLRRFWPEVIDAWRRNQSSWIDSPIRAAASNPNGHFADAGKALKKMKDCGVSDGDIASVARMVAYETAFAILTLIDEGTDSESPIDVCWQIMEAGPDGVLTGRQLYSLHELILAMDPSGREGRPA